MPAMRRWLIVLVVVAGCGGEGPDSPVDGFWRADTHTLSFSGGHYEAGDRDAAGTCREAGSFQVVGDSIELARESAACANGPRAALSLGAEQILRAEPPRTLVYVRANPNVIPLPAEPRLP